MIQTTYRHYASFTRRYVLSMAIRSDPPAVISFECARQSLVIRETEEVERMR